MNSTTTSNNTTFYFSTGGTYINVFRSQAPPRPTAEQKAAAFLALRTRFRALAREHHPDVGGNPETMKTLNGWYAQEKRAALKGHRLLRWTWS